MAKGQKRSNKEVKKPKQVKPKAPAEGSTVSARLSGQNEKGGSRKT